VCVVYSFIYLHFVVSSLYMYSYVQRHLDADMFANQLWNCVIEIVIIYMWWIWFVVDYTANI